MRALVDIVKDLRVVFTLVPWRMRPKLILLLLGSIATALMDMAAIVLMLPVMEIATGNDVEDSATFTRISDLTGVTGTENLLLLVLGTAVALMVGKSLATIAFRWWSVGVMARAQSAALHSVTTLYSTSPWIHHRRRSSSDIQQTVNFYIPAAFENVTSAGLSLVVDGISIVAILIALIWVSPTATFTALVFFGGAAFLIQALMKGRLLKLGRRVLELDHRSWGYLHPLLDGLKELRIAGAEAGFTQRFADVRRQSALASRAKTVMLELPKHLLEIVMILGILVIALILLSTTDQGQAFALLGVFAIGAMRMIPALNRMVATLGIIRSNVPNLAELVKEITTLRSETGRRPAHDDQDTHRFPDGNIEFSDLTFQFPDAEAPVLDGVSGVIEQGQTVALVGSSGAGKTTFVELLLTLFNPNSGTMTVDGVPIHDHPVPWRKNLGVVTQDVFLVDRSMRENIALGVPPEEIDEERLQQAVDMAQLRPVVDGAPHGLDTIVGARGTRVSGGQRQRLGIARALYRNPRVLVLDEATSALDNETEARITETIQALHGKMTIVVVAHRLSTVKHADKIFFFSQGKITGEGPMDELAQTNADFAHLVELGRLS